MSDPISLDEASFEGGCACGAVRYRVRGAPIYSNNCHCGLCQRQSGAASVFNGLYEDDRFALLSGELTRHDLPTGSGGVQEIFRCAGCGSAIWSHYPRVGRLGKAVRMGTLDHAEAFRPDAAIYIAAKLPWVALADDTPQFDAGYDFRQVLPPERLARLHALADRAKAAAA